MKNFSMKRIIKHWNNLLLKVVDSSPGSAHKTCRCDICGHGLVVNAVGLGWIWWSTLLLSARSVGLSNAPFLWDDTESVATDSCCWMNPFPMGPDHPYHNPGLGQWLLFLTGVMKICCPPSYLWRRLFNHVT